MEKWITQFRSIIIFKNKHVYFKGCGKLTQDCKGYGRLNPTHPQSKILIFRQHKVMALVSLQFDMPWILGNWRRCNSSLSRQILDHDQVLLQSSSYRLTNDDWWWRMIVTNQSSPGLWNGHVYDKKQRSSTYMYTYTCQYTCQYIYMYTCTYTCQYNYNYNRCIHVSL